MLKHIALLLAALGCGSLLCPVQAGEPSSNVAGKMLRDASLMLLKEGNDRYVAGKAQHPNVDTERRNSTAAGQEPFATVLACSDSRSPVELLFDRGVGDLFVIRVAGNIAGESELASLEYGVEHLNTPVLVVLGHSRCGAVTAVTKGAPLHGHLPSIAEKIQPAAEKARAESTDPNDLIPRAIQANVWNTMERVLRESSVIREKVESGAAHVVGAIYDLESGRVAWLGSHPAQDAIVTLANQTQTDVALVSSQNGQKTVAPPATEAARTSTAQNVPAGPVGTVRSKLPHGAPHLKSSKTLVEPGTQPQPTSNPNQ
jgi:carbonic anhydrase